MTPQQRAAELQGEIDAIQDELDDGTEQWMTTDDGPSWAYLEMLGKQQHVLKRELDEITAAQPA